MFHPISAWNPSNNNWEDWEVDLTTIGMAKHESDVPVTGPRGIRQMRAMRRLYLCNLSLQLQVLASDWEALKAVVHNLPFWYIAGWDSINFQLLHADINPYLISAAKLIPQGRRTTAGNRETDKQWGLCELFLRGLDVTLVVPHADWDLLKKVRHLNSRLESRIPL